MASPLVCPPNPSSPHTSLHPPSLATAVVRAIRWEIKKRGCCCLLAGAMDACFSLLLFSPLLPHLLHTHRRGSEGGREKAILCCVPPHHLTPLYPAPPVERERATEERREGGQGHVIRRACGHSFTPRQNERGPAVSLLHD